MSHRRWTREEQLLVLNLYCKIPFGQFDQRNPNVIQLAQRIARTPGAVAMKLSNFASLDPVHQARGIKGLDNVSRSDRELWQEFMSDWNNLPIESESLAEEVLPQIHEFSGDTEREATVKVRRGQRFFRQMILGNYQEKCCICGMPLPPLLVASHIVPWREAEDLRVDPSNGLCLCSLHDKAFDSGLLTISVDYHVLLSSQIKYYSNHLPVELNFTDFHGKEIALPDKFWPKPDYLKHHIVNIFKA